MQHTYEIQSKKRAKFVTISKVSLIVLIIKKFQSLDTVWEEIGLENKNKTP